MEEIKINQTIENYLRTIESGRSENTGKAYRNGMNTFIQSLEENGYNIHEQGVQKLSENLVIPFIAKLKEKSPATERLYLTAVVSYFEYLVSENLVNINLARVRLLIRQRARRPGQRLPQFPRDSIDYLLGELEKINQKSVEDDQERFRNLRDMAFMFTLADTGLRVHEACNLTRGDIDWNEGKALIIGKGDKQAVVRFSNRSMNAIRKYLSSRAKMDGNTGRSLGSLALFSRHDRGTGNVIKKITTTTGRNIINARVQELLGQEFVGRITPHSFRHYFVTKVLQASGNLKLAQELARHVNIAVTQRYAHLADDELDRQYYEIFDE